MFNIWRNALEVWKKVCYATAEFLDFSSNLEQIGKPSRSEKPELLIFGLAFTARVFGVPDQY